MKQEDKNCYDKDYKLSSQNTQCCWYEKTFFYNEKVSLVKVQKNVKVIQLIIFI